MIDDWHHAATIKNNTTNFGVVYHDRQHDIPQQTCMGQDGRHWDALPVFQDSQYQYFLLHNNKEERIHTYHDLMQQDDKRLPTMGCAYMTNDVMYRHKNWWDAPRNVTTSQIEPTPKILPHSKLMGEVPPKHIILRQDKNSQTFLVRFTTTVESIPREQTPILFLTQKLIGVALPIALCITTK